MMKWQKGSITVFLCIVLAVLVPLCGILIDLSRYNKAMEMAKSSLKLCTESMLAAYDRQLREQFGLFAMYPRDIASVEKEIFELLSDNLTPENADGKVTDLYQFRVNRVEVTPLYNLSEPYVIEQQITEFMKYRAPVQAISEFVEKLKAMIGLMKEGDMVERSMTIDKLLNSLRENLIYYALLLSEKMKSINEFGKGTFKHETITDIKTNNEMEKNNKPAIDKINAINEKMLAYKSVKVECDQARLAYDQAGVKLEPVSQRKSSLESSISAAEAERTALIKESEEEEEDENENDDTDTDANAQSPDTTAIDSRISSLESELSDLMPQYNSLNETYIAAGAKFDTVSTDLYNIQKELKALLSPIINQYETMNEYTLLSIQALLELSDHIDLHLRYCTKAIELAEAIIPQIGEIQSEKSALETKMKENPDSAVTGQIGSDLNKKLLSVDTDLFNSMIAQLKANKVHLEGWLAAVEKSKTDLNSAFLSLSSEIDQLRSLMNDPGEGTATISIYTGHNNNSANCSALESALIALESYSTMKTKGVFIIPDYELSPVAVENEKKGFGNWHANTFLGATIEEPAVVENPGLDKARGQMGQAAGGIAVPAEEEKESDENGGDLLDVFAEGMYLPSGIGSISSDDNLDKIEAEVYETEQDQLINPFEAAPQGYEAVNEKDKNFFDYEMERIRKLLDTITELVSNAGESIIKSLYMNEYIVSAFKNATTQNNQLEYDIGWDRPLDTTYFDKGEVEYIIFGNGSESQNIAASKRSVFAIRLIFNLLHVYTDPLKLSHTLEFATVIAGWTIFGVPIVQNFLLISWAAFESWVDSEMLLNGKEVPLIKTTKSWYLDWETLKDYLLGKVMIEAKKIAVNTANELIDEGAAYLEDTVTAFINSKIDELFVTVEEGWQEVNVTVGEEVKAKAKALVESFELPELSGSPIALVDTFLAYIKNYWNEKINAICSSISNEGVKFIAECKAAVKAKVHDLIFGSVLYTGLKQKVKELAKEVIDKGIHAATEGIEKVMGASDGRSSGGNNVMGRLIMMNYTDYLRLMLLAVPSEKKALRAADLMQLDMHETAPENSGYMNTYYTALYVKAYIDINLWFIPEGLYKNGKDGMIVVEWSQGY